MQTKKLGGFRMKRCTVAGSRTVTTSKTSFLTSKLPFPCVFLLRYFIFYVNLFLDALLRVFCVKDSVIRLWWLLTGAGISLTTKFSRILCLDNFFVFHKINPHPHPPQLRFQCENISEARISITITILIRYYYYYHHHHHHLLYAGYLYSYSWDKLCP